MLNYLNILEKRHQEVCVKDLHPEVKKLWYSRNEELSFLPEVELEFKVIDHEEYISNNSLKEILWEVVNKLKPRERNVLDMRFRLGMTLDEIGCCLELSKERIRQIEAKAIRRLRHPLINETLTKTLPTALLRSDQWFKSYNKERKGINVLTDVKFDIPENFFSVYKVFSDQKHIEYIFNRSVAVFKERLTNFHYGILKLISEDEDVRSNKYIFVMNDYSIPANFIDEAVSDVLKNNNIGYVKSLYSQTK